MKKFFLFAISMVLSSTMYGQYSLMIENSFELTHDTTITVNHWEINFEDEPEMGFNGIITSSAVVYVDITRPAGAKDELCAGSCFSGNGQASQTMTFDLSAPFYAGKPTMLFAHYTPEAEGTAVYTYTFRSGAQSATLTVNYVYDPKTPVEQAHEAVCARKVVRNGQVVVLRDGKAYNMLGTKL